MGRITFGTRKEAQLAWKKVMQSKDYRNGLIYVGPIYSIGLHEYAFEVWPN